MKKASLIEYLSYWLIRCFSLVVIASPPKANFILGRALGISGYYLLKKKRNLALKNLKTVFRDEFEYWQIERIAKKAFISLALDIIEALYIPKIDSRYINKHIRIENLKFLDEALKKGKGAILLAYHLGNWELSNITCSLEGYDYKVIVNEQRYPLLNELLNRYRQSKGCKIIPRGMALREIIKALKSNQVVAMAGDQGGKEGYLSEMFGLPISTPSGFLRFALNTHSAIIPAIIVRERRFYHRIILEAPLEIQGKDSREALENCLRKSNAILERYIREYPQEYFWFYKIWKYSPFKNVIVLSDGKAGHLRQMEALERIVGGLGLTVYSKIIEIRFKNRLAKILANVCAGFGLDIFELCVREESYLALRRASADLVISCGASLAGLNLAIARDNLARSVCVMNPGIAGRRRFDLVIMPKHDGSRQRKNIVITDGALNLIDQDYLDRQTQGLLEAIIPDKALNNSMALAIGSRTIARGLIGVLIGGDTKKYKLTQRLIAMVSSQIKKAASDLGMDILLTTSRRTPRKAEETIKKEFGGLKECPLLVIANERNIPQAVGGILGLCECVVVSGESISMVSEAAASGKYVLVFRLKGTYLGKEGRHERFLRNLESEGYVRIIQPENIADKIKELIRDRPPIKKLDDRAKVKEAMKKLL
ncbi:MAG: ELM1/GtrOC1 family putative glycosyltransferase [Candidatus Omnitrophota bacterium]